MNISDDRTFSTGWPDCTIDYAAQAANLNATPDLDAFADEFRRLEADFRIDSEGGSEWRTALTYWLCAKTGLSTDPHFDLIRDVIEYVEFHDVEDLTRGTRSR